MPMQLPKARHHVTNEFFSLAPIDLSLPLRLSRNVQPHCILVSRDPMKTEMFAKLSKKSSPCFLSSCSILICSCKIPTHPWSKRSTEWRRIYKSLAQDHMMLTYVSISRWIRGRQHKRPPIANDSKCLKAFKSCKDEVSRVHGYSLEEGGSSH
jgi:hypothetical protein